MTLLSFIGRWSRNCRRSIDLAILWPQCLAIAQDLPHAQAVFMLHITNDPAWTTDYTHDELVEIVERLT